MPTEVVAAATIYCPLVDMAISFHGSPELDGMDTHPKDSGT
jgi:hypothetical protein